MVVSGNVDLVVGGMVVGGMVVGGMVVGGIVDGGRVVIFETVTETIFAFFWGELNVVFPMGLFSASPSFPDCQNHL